MKHTKQYLVKWVIDIEANSPEEAAKLALEIQRDENSEALAFTVKEQATGEETDVNLLDTILTKFSKIDYIKKVISKWGSFTTAEVEADYSPAISVIGDHSVLVESFWNYTVTAYEYVDSICVCEEDIRYEDLDEEVINDICTLVENWESEQIQTEKRCEN
ncbi:hypothetical protein AUJ10_03800 [Candidatus Pacearchaeota archaeon CG1_02_31_27]|nr:MAG: hypothetical protein AUJ10_03800 [Candidatus Pacearchaeota archaeon CG1_02_31_27]